MKKRDTHINVSWVQVFWRLLKLVPEKSRERVVVLVLAIDFTQENEAQIVFTATDAFGARVEGAG
jgi:hypothetical protein